MTSPALVLFSLATLHQPENLSATTTKSIPLRSNKSATIIWKGYNGETTGLGCPAGCYGAVLVHLLQVSLNASTSLARPGHQMVSLALAIMPVTPW